MLQVWVAMTAHQNIARVRNVLSDDERERSTAFRRDEVRDQYIIAHALKRVSIANTLGVRDPRRLRFARLGNGKPVLLSAPMNFNLSHSRGACAIVLSTRGPCGIDIETHRLNRNLPIELLRTMTDQEGRRISASDNHYAAFIARWVLKEAFVKVSGLGLADRFDQICTETEIEWRGQEFGAFRRVNVWRRITDEYAIAMCASGLGAEASSQAARPLAPTELGDIVVQGIDFPETDAMALAAPILGQGHARGLARSKPSRTSVGGCHAD